MYGGGGIYPDVVMPEARAGARVAGAPGGGCRARRGGSARYLTENAAAFTTADALAAAPRLPDAALAQFRAFAQQQGHAVPAGAEADRALQRLLVAEIAGTKWGSAGYYRLQAALDEQIGVAVGEFARASGILGGN